MKAVPKIAIVLAVIGAVAVTLALKGERNTPDEEATTMVVINDAPADTSDAADTPAETGNTPEALPRLLELGSDKCIPCKAMAPILDELEREYPQKFKVEFIDVWKNQAAGKEYGVQMIPTQIFFDAEGKEQFRHTGFFAKEDILAKWKELGVL